MLKWIARFAPRFQEQLNVTAGIVALGGVLLAVAGLSQSGRVRQGLLYSGIAVVCIVLLICAVKARPPKVLDPAKISGKELPIADLRSLPSNLMALGILGAGGVGKSTLKRRLLEVPMAGLLRTQRLTMHVSALLHDPTTYVAILDGKGVSIDQQFEIADNSGIILLLIDHNDIESTALNTNRIEEHRNFGLRIRSHLVNSSNRRGPIHLLLNKRDEWEHGTEGEIAQLRAFFAEQVQFWEAAFGDDVSSATYSNNIEDDLPDLVETIKSAQFYVKSRQ